MSEKDPAPIIWNGRPFCMCASLPSIQVNNNLESQKLQYAMQERLRHFRAGARSRS